MLKDNTNSMKKLICLVSILILLINIFPLRAGAQNVSQAESFYQTSTMEFDVTDHAPVRLEVFYSMDTTLILKSPDGIRYNVINKTYQDGMSTIVRHTSITCGMASMDVIYLDGAMDGTWEITASFSKNNRFLLALTETPDTWQTLGENSEFKGNVLKYQYNSDTLKEADLNDMITADEDLSYGEEIDSIEENDQAGILNIRLVIFIAVISLILVIMIILKVKDFRKKANEKKMEEERIQKEKDEKEERKRNRSKTDKIRLQKMLENCTDDYTDEPGSLNTDTDPKYINTEGEMIQKDKEIIIEKNEDTPIIQNRF